MVKSSSNLSVVIPAFNRAELIAQTLRSLLNQTLPADEIIVVDDGSTDSTAEAAESEFSVFSRRFSGKGKLPRFQVIRQMNAGPAAARNRGFAESRGEFIHFFDSDDIAAPNKHEVQMQVLRESGADIAVGPWVKGRITEHGAGPLARSADGSERSVEHGASIDGGEHGPGRKRYSYEPEGFVLQQKGLPKGNLVREFLTRWSLVPHACLFRRDIVEKVGGYPEDCFGTEDTFFFLACMLAGARFEHSPGTLELYRLGNAKITDAPQGNRRHVHEWGRVLCKMHQACTACGIDPSNWFGFRARAWQAGRDYQKFGILDPDVSARLQTIARGTPGAMYQIYGRYLRYRGGLKHRLLGTRENGAFRTASLTQDQIALMESAGYAAAR